MKKLMIIFGLFITTNLLAQNCTSFLYMQKGKTIEKAMYNLKGDEISKTIEKVLAIDTSNGVVTSTVALQQLKKNGKLLTTENAYYKCTGTGIILNMPVQYTQSDDTSRFVWPFEMQIGTIIKKGHSSDITKDSIEDRSTLDAAGTLRITTKYRFTMRKEIIDQFTDATVVGTERLTTLAGTWNCFKIVFKTTNLITETPVSSGSYELIRKLSNFAVVRGYNLEFTIWFAYDFGIIKYQVIGAFTAPGIPHLNVGVTNEVTAIR